MSDSRLSVASVSVAALLGACFLSAGCSGDLAPRPEQQPPIEEAASDSPDAADEASDSASTSLDGASVAEPATVPATVPATEPATEPVAEPPQAATTAAQRAAWSKARTAAQTALAEGRFQEAIALSRQAEKDHGDQAELRLLGAAAFLARGAKGFADGADKFYVKGMIADAHARLDAARKLDPEVVGAAVLLAKILRWEENPDEARRVLGERLDKAPNDRDAHLLLAEMNFTGRRWEGARQHYDRAFELDPTDGRARLNATIARQWLKVPSEKLVEGYLTAARLLPEEHRPLDLLGGFHKGDKEARLALFRRALVDNPKAVWARVWIAHIQANEGEKDIPGALKTLEEASALAPDEPSVHFNLGRIREQSEKFVPAIQSYVRALECGQTNAMQDVSNTLDRLLVVRRADPKIDRKLRNRAYDLLTQRNPLEGRFGNNAGLWHRDVSHDYEASLKYYSAAVDAEPEDQDFLNDCALIYQFHLTDRLDKALPMYLKVVELVEEDGQDPIRGYWDTLENLCKHYFRTGEYDKVLECAKKRSSPDAIVNGRPYPSMRSRQWAVQAQRRLDSAKDDQSPPPK